jgi:hypothetical protein
MGPDDPPVGLNVPDHVLASLAPNDDLVVRDLQYLR